MHKDSWDDLRFALAVADGGSVSAAARLLGVNHATVLRRLSALEARFQTELFIKDPLGYRLSNEGKAVIEALRDAQNAVSRVERLLKGTSTGLMGDIRLTSTDSMCELILPKVINAISLVEPALRFSLLSANSHMDFSRLAADLTLRPTTGLGDEMTGVQVGEVSMFVYGAPNVHDTWLGMDGPLSRSAPAKWQADNTTKEQIAGSADSFLVLAAMAAMGQGQCYLPCFVARKYANLQRRLSYPRVTVPLWIASQTDLAETPKIRTARTLLTKELQKFGDELRGSP